MKQSTQLNESQVVDGSSLFRMRKTEAIEEIATQIFEFKIYARHRNLSLLAHLLGMAEIEARQALADTEPAAYAVPGAESAPTCQPE